MINYFSGVHTDVIAWGGGESYRKGSAKTAKDGQWNLKDGEKDQFDRHY